MSFSLLAPRDPQAALIVGAALEVHRALGCGFVDDVYRVPLEIELAARDVPCAPEVAFPVVYKGRRTGVTIRADFVCFGEIVVSVMAAPEIGAPGRTRARNQLRASGLSRALLLNFGARTLQVERMMG